VPVRQQDCLASRFCMQLQLNVPTDVALSCPSWAMGTCVLVKSMLLLQVLHNRDRSLRIVSSWANVVSSCLVDPIAT
jgi:hypothetical protein